MVEVLKNSQIFKVHDGAVTARTEITQGKGLIRHIIWNGADTDGHKASLVDTDNNILWQASVTGATEINTAIRDLNINIPFDGLWCDDLDSGELIIYHSQLTNE